MRQTLSIIVLFAVTASTLGHQLPNDPILEKCKTDHNITDDLLIELDPNPEGLLEDPKLRCFAACVLTETKVLKPDGTLNEAYVIKYLPENIANREEIIEAFNGCANETGVDNCETAYKTVVCINSKDVIRNMKPSEENGKTKEEKIDIL